MVGITGRTLLLGIVADPVRHVQTPQHINEYLRSTHVDAVMVPVWVRPSSLGAVLHALRYVENLAGLVVTVPHKTSAAGMCATLSQRAAKVGAVNVVRRRPDGSLVGDMFDGVGFVQGLAARGVSLPEQSVYLAGAGGAARAIAFELVDAGIGSLKVWNRTKGKAEALCARLRAGSPSTHITVGTRDASENTMVINATSLGLRDEDDYPVDTSTLNSGQLVCDIIMEPRETKLLRAAAKRGCAIHHGVAMLEQQIPLMAKFLVQPLEAPTIQQATRSTGD